jgi:hypothetical protein
MVPEHRVRALGVSVERAGVHQNEVVVGSGVFSNLPAYGTVSGDHPQVKRGVPTAGQRPLSSA